MNTPRVSILLPIYNGEKHLEEAIQSILGQTMPDWELLLIDDGSRDASPALAQRYAAAHPDKVRYLEHPEHANHGQLATRALGARHARADVVAMLDQDDLWNKDYLEKHLRIWDAVQDQGVYLSYGPGVYWHPQDTFGQPDFVQPVPLGSPRVYAPGEVLSNYLATVYADTPCPSCTLLRREVLEQARVHEKAAKGSPYEDQYLWWYVAARWPIAIHREALVRYRQHSDSALGRVATSGEEPLRADLTFLKTIYQDLKAWMPDHPLLVTGQLASRIYQVGTQVQAVQTERQRATLQELKDHVGHQQSLIEQQMAGLAELQGVLDNQNTWLQGLETTVQQHNVSQQELQQQLQAVADQQQEVVGRQQAQLDEQRKRIQDLEAFVAEVRGTLSYRVRSRLKRLVHG